jgi:GxxExxY protein
MAGTVDNELTGRIVGAAIEVHRHLGPGLLESAYRACLVDELKAASLHVRSEVALPINYKGRVIEGAYRADLVVEGTVLVELKAVEFILPIHEAQTLTYMRLGNLPVGLLLNFNVPRLKDGIRRFIARCPNPTPESHVLRVR